MNNLSDFYFIRHGQTDWNAMHKVQFHANIPLNDKGRAQALQAAEKLKAYTTENKNTNFYIVHSVLGRAAETARIIERELQQHPHVNIMGVGSDARFNERHGGTVDGMLYEDFMKLAEERVPAGLDPWDNTHYICPQMERPEEISKRMYQALANSLQQAAEMDAKLLVVGHFGSMHTFAKLNLGLCPHSVFENATPYKFVKSGSEWLRHSL